MILLMLLSLLDNAMPFINAALAGLIGYFLGRKKENAQVRKMEVETDLLEIKGADQVIEFWQNTANDFKAEVIKLRAEVVELRKENSDLRSVMNELKALVSKQNNQ